MASGEIWADEIVDEKLWLGAGRDAENLPQLRAHGITHILNVADDVPNFHEAEPDLTYLCLNVADFGGGSRHAYPAAVEFVRDAWAGTGGGRVLVHCANGSNRSATVTIAVCMKLLGLTLAESWALVCERRKAAAPLADNRAVSIPLPLGSMAEVARDSTSDRARVRFHFVHTTNVLTGDVGRI